jgi:hypothetical protein
MLGNALGYGNWPTYRVGALTRLSMASLMQRLPSGVFNQWPELRECHLIRKIVSGLRSSRNAAALIVV